MLWIWSCPVGKKELLLEKAVPKRLSKSLKTTSRVVTFLLHLQAEHQILKTNLSQVFFKGFACDATLYGIVKNITTYFSEAFRCFSHYQFITLLPFSYQIFEAAFF